MNFNFLNPLSDDFLQTKPDAAELRKMEMQINSVGVDEDQNAWNDAAAELVNTLNNRDGATNLDCSQSSMLFDGVFQNKMQKISFYRNMALYPLVKKAVTIMTDEAICPKTDGTVANFEVKPEFAGKFADVEVKQLHEEFKYIMNCVIGNERVWNLFYRWIVDAEQFWENVPNSAGDSLVGIKVLPAYCTLAIYRQGEIEGFIEDANVLMQMGNESNARTFGLDQVSYSSYGFWGSSRNDIIGHLHPAIRPLNQLKAVEDSLVITRLTRAPEKRVFNIYTGKVPRNQAAAIINDAKSKYRKNFAIDPTTGAITSQKNVQAFSEDFFFSKSDAGAGSTVENIKGATEFNGQLDDVKMFQQMVMDAMQIPNCRWNAGEAGTAYATAPEQQLDEITFQKLCRRLAKTYAHDMVLHTFMTQLKLRGYPEKFLDSNLYDVSFHGATDFQKIRELANAEKVGTLLSTFTQFLPTGENVKPNAEVLGPIFSKEFFLKKYCKLTTEEYNENADKLQNEIDNINESAKSASEEASPADEDEDLGF